AGVSRLVRTHQPANAGRSPQETSPVRQWRTIMNPFNEYVRNITRRHFFATGSHAVGWAALASLLKGERAVAAPAPTPLTHFAPKAKHVIYLHMVGGPPQM